MSTNSEKIEIKGMLITTKYALEDEVYVLHNNKIYKAVITTVTKTEVVKDIVGKYFPDKQETYGLTLTKNGFKLTRTNNVGELFDTVEELLENIEILE